MHLSGVRFSCAERIEVGDDSILAESRILDTDFHAVETGGQHRSKTKGVTKPVILGSNVWIGTGAIILKGVTIGANSVVGAGSVVVGSVKPNVVVLGNPARVVKRLEDVALGAGSTDRSPAFQDGCPESQALPEK